MRGVGRGVGGDVRARRVDRRGGGPRRRAAVCSAAVAGCAVGGVASGAAVARALPGQIEPERRLGAKVGLGARGRSKQPSRAASGDAVARCGGPRARRGWARVPSRGPRRARRRGASGGAARRLASGTRWASCSPSRRSRSPCSPRREPWQLGRARLRRAVDLVLAVEAEPIAVLPAVEAVG